MAPCLVEHVVADAGAFLKKAPLQEIGKNIYTLKDVVEEIRDKPTRRSLAFLPYELKFKDPLPEHIRTVTEFSKRTGDYASLSATDIKVLALTYQLELEHVGSQHLKKEPDVKKPNSSKNTPSHTRTNSCSEPQTETEQNEEFNSFHFWREPLPLLNDDLLSLLEEEEQEEDEEDQDGGGWITPSNIKQVKMDTGNWSQPEDVTVGCLTTDFAMQNVLIQIGLHVLSVNGMVIKQARNYILRCHACFKTTTHMERVFCPHCGNKTLKKLAVTVNEDGSIQMHFSRNPKVLNPKGLRYSLPLPQGGKHGDNPHLVEDQRFPQQRLSRKARQKTNVFDPDYIAGSSPFSQNDIYSRAAGLNLRDSQSGAGRRRANPNAAGKKFVKK
uniref:RNA-binding protein NOB1 n=1 Tax=Periophthalmus magnuspinnatus TaxID=409849 RepID=A0A3B4BL49_9GOBI